MDVHEVRYPDIRVLLVGESGNAFAILGRVQKELRRAGVEPDVIQEFVRQATAGDYDHLLQTVMAWVTVEAAGDTAEDDYEAVETRGKRSRKRMGATRWTPTNSTSGGHDPNNKKTAARKSAVRKPAVRKAGAPKRARKPRVVHPMTSAIGEIGPAVVGYATERAMASENLGVTGTRSKELPGKRTGLATVLTLDDGTRITFRSACCSLTSAGTWSLDASM